MTIAKPQTPTLIDTISAGYAALNRRLWVLIIPVALDLYLWLGARLSLGPFLDNLRGSLVAFAGLLSPEPQYREQVVHNIQHADMRALLALLNFVPVLPSRVLLNDRLAGTTVVAVSAVSEVVVLVLVINLFALVISSVFLTGLANGVRNERRALANWVRRVPQVAWHICGYLLVVLGVGFMLGLPFLVLSAIVVGALPAAALPVLFAWLVVWFWVYIYTGFAVEAIVVGDAGPLRAIYNSVNIVRRNLLSTLGLILISLVIVAGLEVVWQILAGTLWGVLLAIVSSAYVGSGLAAARLVFYRERLFRWHGLA